MKITSLSKTILTDLASFREAVDSIFSGVVIEAVLVVVASGGYDNTFSK